MRVLRTLQHQRKHLDFQCSGIKAEKPFAVVEAEPVSQHNKGTWPQQRTQRACDYTGREPTPFHSDTYVPSVPTRQ